VLGAVAVAAVVLLALFALGLFGGSSSPSSSPSGAPLSFESAFGRGESEARAATGSPWTVVAAEGLGIASGVSGWNLGTVLGGGCSVSPAPGAPAVISLLGTPSNATSGEVAEWLFFATNASDSAVLMIAVTASSSAPISIGTGSSCLGTFLAFPALNGSAVVDSTVAARAFDSGGGAAWAQNHSVLSRTFVLAGSAAEPGVFVWVVSYSTCNFATSGGSGLELTGGIDASSGALLGSPAQSATSC
jgi:hypothetical protein